MIENETIERAIKSLLSGELVIFPTETVYGLGADANNQKAIKKIYQLKKRPINHPLIVHLANKDQINDWAEISSEETKEWITLFSPGPVTFVLKKKPHVLNALTGDQPTIALRIPEHPIAKILLERFNSGIAAPSANPYGYISPTRIEHIPEEWHHQVGALIDGGACKIGLESTIIDLTEKQPRICRIGYLPKKIRKLMESRGVNFNELSSSKRLPGNVFRHYSPRNPLILLPFQAIEEFLAESSNHVTILSFEKPKTINNNLTHWIQMPKNPKNCSFHLYDYLRLADEKDSSIILVEKPPIEDEWLPIQDRLNRAAYKA